jgi:hypothetical protein
VFKCVFEDLCFIMHLKLWDLLVSIWLKIEFNWSLKNFNFDFCHVLLRYCGILGFGVQVHLLVIWTPYFIMHLKLWNLLVSLWLKTKFNWSLKNFNSKFYHVLLRYNDILRFNVQVCFLAIWGCAMVQDKICVIKSVSGVDKVLLDMNIIPSWYHSFSDVESVHQ